MTQQEKNIQAIKEMFEAVNRGDVRSVLDLLSDTIDWQSPVTSALTEPVSWSKPRKSRDEVAAFFDELNANVKIREMRPVNYVAQGDLVVVEGTMWGRVISTGRDYSVNWLMMIALHNGKLVRMHNYYDTAGISNAFMMEMRRAA